MNLKKSIFMMLYVTIILGLVSHAYSADTHRTYTDTLDISVGDEYMGEYSDYRMYWVNLDKDQKIELKLEVPEGADFDLFVEYKTQRWSNVSDTLGEDEELNVTAPETGVYKFVVAAWSGSGQFTLNWGTPGAGLSIPIYVLIGILIVVVVVVITVIVLLLRRKTRVPPPPAPVYAPTPAQAPVSTPEAPETPQSQCPDCGGQLTWIEQYQRWYCYKCSKYV